MLEDYNMHNIFTEADNSSMHYSDVNLSSPAANCEFLYDYQGHDNFSSHQITPHHHQQHYPRQPQQQQPQQQHPQQHHPRQPQQQQSRQQHPQQQHPQQCQQQHPQQSQQNNSVQVNVPVIVPVNQRKLPEPCPVPYNCFSEDVIRAIDNNQITGIIKIRLIRQAASFYCGICPKPTHDDYVNMAKTLCDHYAQLKDKRPANNLAKKFVYYVSYCADIILA